MEDKDVVANQDKDIAADHYDIDIAKDEDEDEDYGYIIICVIYFTLPASRCCGSAGIRLIL